MPAHTLYINTHSLTHTHTHACTRAQTSTHTHTHLTNLVEIIHKHLAHFIDRNSGVDRAVQFTFAHHVGESTQVEVIRVRQQDCINLMHIPACT